MPNTNRPLPIACPKCHQEGCLLVVKSLTIMTVRCPRCEYTWATDLRSLPKEIQQKIPDVLKDL